MDQWAMQGDGLSTRHQRLWWLWDSRSMRMRNLFRGARTLAPSGSHPANVWTGQTNLKIIDNVSWVCKGSLIDR